MNVSVVVETITAREDSTGDLAADLRPTMEGIAQQSVAPDEVIIVLDDLVGEATASELQQRYPSARFTSSRASNYFAAKNAGAQAAAGDIVALLDGDCVPAPDWLETLLARLTPEVDGVAGKTRYAGRSLLARIFSVPDFSYVLEKEGGVSTGMNINNVVIRREVFLQHPFDERIRRNGGCYFLFNQLRTAGVRVDYEPNARTSHAFPGGAAMIRKHLDRGYDGVTIYRLDEQCVLRGTRAFRRFGPLALAGITVRRILLDWVRLVRHRRQIGISLFAIPLLALVGVMTRSLELAGGLMAIVKPTRYTARTAV